AAGNLMPSVVPANPLTPNAWIFNTVIEREWEALADAPDSAPLAAGIVTDYRRRTQAVSAGIAQRLRAALPAGATDVAICGVDVLTLPAIQGARALGLRILGLYTTTTALVGDSFGGIPILDAADLPAHAALPIVLASTAPTDVKVAREKVRARS